MKEAAAALLALTQRKLWEGNTIGKETRSSLQGVTYSSLRHGYFLVWSQFTGQSSIYSSLCVSYRLIPVSRAANEVDTVLSMGCKGRFCYRRGAARDLLSQRFVRDYHTARDLITSASLQPASIHTPYGGRCRHSNLLMLNPLLER